MFDCISIIGCGLIGSSIIRAISEKHISKKIVIYDKSSEALSFLKKEIPKIEVAKDLFSASKNADLLIVATPLSSYEEIFLTIKDCLKKNAIITDTGSVKKEINKIIENLDLKNNSWIASHPIAGTEDSGPKAGYAKLFENRWCIISPSPKAKKDEIIQIQKFWKLLGSKVKVMSFEEHDYILSLTSHLPHAIAYSLVRTAIDSKDKFKKEVIQYSAGGLRDFTRIAASDPVMWRDIFLDNSENILKTLDNFSNNLEELKKVIKEKNGKELIKIFSSTKEVRKEIIKAGQDTEQPNFGRKKD
ncbi:prephenate dehydrogenase/arogenate dehydrogenase family protein [Pelagibacteraceae bacterium]|jgi:cyclohexadieny/prephenate dehydrogenase|nr:prephenate dehydrogenase/arogenate dehydrogenase family protein [Pelagibacteraceae bacterium]|tara:strand:+ start:189 stop:1094 length:906 start_codon:yes stop_codon:yes gene_type:complete